MWYQVLLPYQLWLDLFCGIDKYCDFFEKKTIILKNKKIWII